MTQPKLRKFPTNRTYHMPRSRIVVPVFLMLAMSHSIPATGQQRHPSNDFNRDGRSDILWHNAANGELAVWFMNSSSRVGRAPISLDQRSCRWLQCRWEITDQKVVHLAPWRIAGTGDFDGDEITELLLVNSSTGVLETQYVYGQSNPYWDNYDVRARHRSTVLGENGIAATAGPPWSIVGISDMNRDRNSDIVWHNSSTGETQIWHMSGHRVVSRATVLGETSAPTLIGLPWRIAGTNDFDNDGKADILWHNGSTGETQIWQMNGYRVTGRATVLGENGAAAIAGLPWTIVSSNDFDYDGTADIVWHNGSTGETQIWFIKAKSVARRANIDASRDGGDALAGAPWAIVRR